jgi:soluble lytic murein transglycosylase-like protein
VGDDTTSVVLRRPGPTRPAGGGEIVEAVVVSALIAGDEAIRALRPRVQAAVPRVRAVPPTVAASLRSPWARAAIGVPLCALALELTSSRGDDRRPAPPDRRPVMAGIVPARYAALIEREARRSRLDPRVVAAVIEKESRFDPRARNPHSGALGLMQLTPSTAHALGVKDPLDPAQAIAGGCRYLRQLLQRFGGDLRLALAAYNAGPTAVDRAGGMPRFPETRAYVSSILRRVAAIRPKRA